MELDIDTGTGFLALLLAEIGYDVSKVDWLKSKLKAADEKIKSSDVPIEFVMEDAEDLSFDDCMFDAVVSRHLIDVPGKHSHLKSHYVGEGLIGNWHSTMVLICHRLREKS